MNENTGKARRRYYLPGQRPERIDRETEVFIHNETESLSRSIAEDSVRIKSENINRIGQSGNSDVDINIDVHVDTTAIAFALLCSLLATKQISTGEFEEATRRLEGLIGQKNPISLEGKNDLSEVKFFKRNIRRY
ncbi:hypothetical protein [Bacillus sp. B-jedd]|uniref:hypothetical protein n=1 Tax=Bacillus sp. B-jedd TaxID=1476857 RepID=UPI0005156477|nr:hypothetical protein [Bacillus sp. B-jedd]CEG29711.1 hypothetical protein BN1002_04670 [Bacillus sp. B-jedd]